MIAPVARFAASAFVLTVASNCARNMLQTAEIRNQIASPEKTIENPLLDSESSVLDCLQTMNRKQLLQVFAQGRAPTSSELNEWFSTENDTSDSEWDAKLLDNDGIIMNGSSEILTNQLFGGNLLPWRLLGEGRKKKGRWNGKAFGRPSSSKGAGKGINRFSTTAGSTFLRHAFDYEITESQVLQKSNEKALRLDYAKYQGSPLSLWWSMHDEVRVVDVDQNQIVMIGMGWMGWSGGALNCSPFLLERSSRKQQ